MSATPVQGLKSRSSSDFCSSLCLHPFPFHISATHAGFSGGVQSHPIANVQIILSLDQFCTKKNSSTVGKARNIVSICYECVSQTRDYKGNAGCMIKLV